MQNIKMAFMLVVLAGLAHADVVLEGYHPVTHRIYIDNIDEYGEYQFFICPTFVGGGAALLDSSEVPGFYKLVSPKLYAVPKGELPANFSEEGFVPPAGALESNTELHVTDSLPDDDPRTEIETHYLISIEDGKIILTEAGEDPAPEEPGEEGPGPVERGPDYYLLIVGLGIGLVLGYIVGKHI